MVLQFRPQLLILPLKGFAPDYFNQLRLLLYHLPPSSTIEIFALVLGALTFFSIVKLRYIYLFASLFGCAAAFGAPVRQTFVSEIVDGKDFPNAVELNSCPV
ncbi:MFS transporter [Sodalis-like endosymbiont of Proechinophthirus fluctus]|uniref:MFS transporter n=1 Tax=Sodalis-like endosymbiont of Proechinophthirus fluctus TaxID=1462730 RepID=UPI00195AB426|nr:MFS transporter [Sodalis-like endosymbiont of Proechinophthirus fluctus]